MYCFIITMLSLIYISISIHVRTRLNMLKNEIDSTTLNYLINEICEGKKQRIS